VFSVQKWNHRCAAATATEDNDSNDDDCDDDVGDVICMIKGVLLDTQLVISERIS